MNRAMVYLAVVGIGGAVLVGGWPGAGPGRCPGPGRGPRRPPRPPTGGGSGKVAVFNVARVMKDYQRWQYYAAMMNQKRTAAAGELGKLRGEITKLQEDIQKEPIKQKQEEMAKVLVDEHGSSGQGSPGSASSSTPSRPALKNLFTEIQRAVVAIVEQNGFDVVFAYPDAISKEEMEFAAYYDLKMRPQAAMPFYVSPVGRHDRRPDRDAQQELPAAGPGPAGRWYQSGPDAAGADPADWCPGHPAATGRDVKLGKNRHPDPIWGRSVG